VAFGAARAVVLASTEEDPEYRAALKDQVALGQAILEGLGHAGTRLHVLEAGDVPALASAFRRAASGVAIGTPATFVVSDDKRTAIEFAVEHFARFSPRPVDEIALPRARRSARCGWMREVHHVHGVRRLLPGIGSHGRRRPAAPQVPRAQLRAVRPVRGDLPEAAITLHPGCC
jgi:hypothetical protein